MKTLLFVALLLQVGGVAAGEWVVQPQPDGTLRMRHEGITAGGSADTLTLRQPANKALSVQVSPTGQGRCEQGDLTIGSLRFPLQTLREGEKVVCGEIASWQSDTSDQLAGLRSVNGSFKGNRSLARGVLPSRIQFGTITFRLQDEAEATLFPVWLDLTALQDQAAVLEGSFNKSYLSFGDVSELSDGVTNTKFKIARTPQANDEAIPFNLRFESAWQRNNEYCLSAADGAISVPYQLSVAGKSLPPDRDYHDTLAAKSPSLLLDIELLIKAKSVRGLAAGTVLRDTLTAVITPDS